jgi:pSer/pThr/pTyr-binding forkhead associated (FHA) protein
VVRAFGRLMDDQPRSPISPHSATPEELRERLEAERRGAPFLVYREEGSGQRIVELPDAVNRFTIGRREGNDLCVRWDAEVSGVHAALERLGADWTLIDDGLSRNGSYVNGSRIMGRRRLRDGDTVRLGTTVFAYRDPTRPSTTRGTAGAQDLTLTRPLSEAQRRVLIALCRPLRESSFAVPATNRDIAQELYVSVDAVKAHMRVLSERFGLEDLPPNEKRARVAGLALESGLVSPRELWD